MSAHVVSALSIRRTDEPPLRYVTVKCPYCHRLHIHGWDGKGSTAGRRRTHCHLGLEYIIVIPEELHEEAA